MGFLDKVKEQAAAAQQVAKEAAQKGQAKLDEVQARRASDALLRDLGAAHYAAVSGRVGPSGDEERIVAALKAHEQANGPIDLSPSSHDGS